MRFIIAIMAAAILITGPVNAGPDRITLHIGPTKTTISLYAFDTTAGPLHLIDFDPATGVVPPEYEVMAASNDADFAVVLSDGATSAMVVDGLANFSVITGYLEAVPAEGSLAPGVYAIEPGLHVASLILRMQALQNRRLNEAWTNRDSRLADFSRHDILVLASLLSAEADIPKEKEMISAVFLNRLAKGIRLMSDPSVIYGVTQGRAPLGRGLRRDEMRTPTAWNTYLNNGLPETPINNPDEVSLAAATRPTLSDALFFASDGQGGHTFAASLEEHNQNLQSWRKSQTSRPTK